MKSRKIVGIDLAGSPKRNTGICTLEGQTVHRWSTLHSDREIISYILRDRPRLIAIDAPLTLPPGRKHIEQNNGEHFRPCDRELLKRGIRFFPITLGPMRLLTKRGIALKRKFRRLGYEVIEIYPGAAQDVWNIARKQDGLNKLRRGLEHIGVHGLSKTMNGDELDAVTGALVGQRYMRGQAEVLGKTKSGGIVMPFPVQVSRPLRNKKA